MCTIFMHHSPFLRQFARESLVQQGGFARREGVEGGADFFGGGVELREKRFDAGDDALLFGEWGEGNCGCLYISKM